MEALSKTGKGESASKENISKLKQKLNTLKQDLTRVEKFIEIARPAKMPDFKPRPTTATTESAKDSKSGKFSGIMVGKRKGGGISTTLRTISPIVKKPEISFPEKIGMSFVDSSTQIDDKDSKIVPPQVSESVQQICQDLEPKKKPIEAEAKNAPVTEKAVSKPEVKKPIRKPVRLPANPANLDSGSDKEEEEPEADVQMNFEEEVWVPPPNQTGDGRTSLNDKFGY